MQEVIIDIIKGAPKIRVKGVAGKACKEITRELESDLGETVKSTDTPEMHQRVTQGNTLKQ